MRLYTNIHQGNIGMLQSKPVWHLDYRLEVTPDEMEMIKTYRQGERTLGKYMHNQDNDEGYISVSEAVAGRKNHVFLALGQVNACIASLTEGCENLRAWMLQVEEIRAGGGFSVRDFPLHPPSVKLPPMATPPPVPPVSVEAPSPA